MIPFEEYIAIDWSGSKTVFSSGLAIARALSNEPCLSLIDPPQKQWSRTHVAEWLLRQAVYPKRLLVGIDSNFGLAASIVRKHAPDIHEIEALWQIVDNICTKESNFYAYPFWNNSLFCSEFWVSGKKPTYFNPARRKTESSCLLQQLGSPETPFKLIGAKQVGKGGLAAMRMAYFLKKKLGEKIAFWPFDSLEAYDRATIVIAEIYPRLFFQKANHGFSKIRNVVKINEVVSFFQASPLLLPSVNDHQADALVSAAGMRQLIENSSPILDLEKCSIELLSYLRLEGWILGVDFAIESQDRFQPKTVSYTDHE